MFQNCGTYQAGSSGIDLSTTCDIDASNCANTVLDESILMSVGNPDIQLLNAQSTFDVGGYCDNGTYDGTQGNLQYKILDGNSVDDAASCSNVSDARHAPCWNDAYASTGAIARCVDGRFTFSVAKPLNTAGGLPAHSAGVSTLFILEVRLIETDPTQPTMAITNGVGRATQSLNIYIGAN